VLFLLRLFVRGLGLLIDTNFSDLGFFHVVVSGVVHPEGEGYIHASQAVPAHERRQEKAERPANA
jgi:sorbitol-specific phosphotransferase system component IIA